MYLHMYRYVYDTRIYGGAWMYDWVLVTSLLLISVYKTSHNEAGRQFTNISIDI